MRRYTLKPVTVARHSYLQARGFASSSSSLPFTGSLPRNYDQLLARWMFRPSATMTAKDLVSSVTALQPNKDEYSVLELAAGTGVCTEEIYQAFSGNCKIVATDVSEEMIDIAQKKEHLPKDRVTFALADAADSGRLCALQEAHNGGKPFDAVVCQFGLMFMGKKKEQVVRNSCRLLEDGGVVLMSVWDRLEHNAIYHLIIKELVKLRPDIEYGELAVPFNYWDAQAKLIPLFDPFFEKVRVGTKTVCPLDDPLSADFIASSAFYGSLISNYYVQTGEEQKKAHASHIAKAISEEFGNPPQYTLSAVTLAASQKKK